MPSRCALTGCDKSACLQAMVPGASHWTYYCCGAHMSEAGAVQSETNRKQREASNRNRESTEEMKQRAVARGPVAVGGSPAPLPAAGAAQTSGSDEGTLLQSDASCANHDVLDRCHADSFKGLNKVYMLYLLFIRARSTFPRSHKFQNFCL